MIACLGKEKIEMKAVRGCALLLCLLLCLTACGGAGETSDPSSTASTSTASVAPVASESSQSIASSVSSESSAAVSSESPASSEASAQPSASSAANPSQPPQQSQQTQPEASVSAADDTTDGRGFSISVTQVGGTTWQDPPTIEITDPEDQQMILNWIDKLTVRPTTGDRENPSMGDARYRVVITQNGATEEYTFNPSTDDVGRHNVSHDGESYLAASDSYDYFRHLFGEDVRSPDGTGVPAEAGTITIAEVGTVEPVVSDPVTVADDDRQEDILGWIDRLASTRQTPDTTSVTFLDVYAVTVTDEWGNAETYQFTNLTDELGRHYVRYGDSWYLAASDSFDRVQYFYRDYAGL